MGGPGWRPQRETDSRRLSEANIAIVGFSEEERNLEAVFMRATKGLVT